MPASEIVDVLVVLLGIAILVTGICRNLPVLFTVILVLIGMLLCNRAQNFPFMASLQGFNLSPEIMRCPGDQAKSQSDPAMQISA
jgi:CPA1 family monovalent cation:H+ antiporter